MALAPRQSPRAARCQRSPSSASSLRKSGLMLRPHRADAVSSVGSAVGRRLDYAPLRAALSPWRAAVSRGLGSSHR